MIGNGRLEQGVVVCGSIVGFYCIAGFNWCDEQRRAATPEKQTTRVSFGSIVRTVSANRTVIILTNDPTSPSITGPSTYSCSLGM